MGATRRGLGIPGVSDRLLHAGDGRIESVASLPNRGRARSSGASRPGTAARRQPGGKLDADNRQRDAVHFFAIPGNAWATGHHAPANGVSSPGRQRVTDSCRSVSTFVLSKSALSLVASRDFSRRVNRAKDDDADHNTKIVAVQGRSTAQKTSRRSLKSSNSHIVTPPVRRAPYSPTPFLISIRNTTDCRHRIVLKGNLTVRRSAD